MCTSCGCRQPNESHGDDRNITMDDLEQAAEAAGLGVGDVIENMRESASGYPERDPEEAALSEE